MSQEQVDSTVYIKYNRLLCYSVNSRLEDPLITDTSLIRTGRLDQLAPAKINTAMTENNGLSLFIRTTNDGPEDVCYNESSLSIQWNPVNTDTIGTRRNVRINRIGQFTSLAIV